jgi:hypothetical protein
MPREDFELPSRIVIRNSCTKLPFAAKWHIRGALSWIEPRDLVGISSIILKDSFEEVDDAIWYQRVISEGLSIKGWYRSAGQGESATITLFLGDLYRGIPGLYRLTPVIRLSIASTLAHEVGHHLIATRGYVFAPRERVVPIEYEEEMAHRYSFSVLKRMNSRWYFKLASFGIKDLAGWHYAQGTLAWKAGNFKRAAESWYKTFDLDPDRQDAIIWYKRAKEMTLKATTSIGETKV